MFPKQFFMLRVMPVVEWSLSLVSETNVSHSEKEWLRRKEGKSRPPPGTSKRWYSLA